MPRRSSKQDPEYLREFLEKYTVDMLRALTSYVATGTARRKGELVDAIARRLEDPQELRSQWAALDSLQQAAVVEVAHGDSLGFDGNTFQAKYGQQPDFGEGRSLWDYRSPTRLGLFFYRRGAATFTMPRDLKERLRDFVPPPRAVETKTVSELPDSITQTWQEYDYKTRTYKDFTDTIPITRLETEAMAQHDLQAVLRLVEVGKIRVSQKTQRPSAASTKVVAKILQGGDFYPLVEAQDQWMMEPGPMRAFAWPLLVQSAGLAKPSGTKLELTPKGRKALTQPAHQVLKTVWQRWLKSKLLDEFNRVNRIRGQTGKGKRTMTAVAPRRQAIVEALQASPVNQWLAFDEFSRFMQAANHTFEVNRDLWNLYIEEQHYGSLGYEGFGDWPIVQGRYLMAFLFEYAATLGLIDVAYIHPSGARHDFRNLWGSDDYDALSRYDGLLYLRINNLGAWCLGLAEKYVPTAPKIEQLLTVLPNRDVVASAPLGAGDVLRLGQFTTQSSDHVWKLDSMAILKALETGDSVAAMVDFLKAKGGGSLPEPIERFFAEIEERAARLTDAGPARLLEVKDAATAHLIANDRELRPHCLLAGERHLVVPAASEKVFRRVVRKLGFSLPQW